MSRVKLRGWFGLVLAPLLILAACSPTVDQFASTESAEVLVDKMVVAMDESGVLGEMATGTKEIIALVEKTGTLDEWLSNMSGEFIDPSLIIERYRRDGLKVGIEGGAGQIDLKAGGAGSALTKEQQTTLNALVQDLVASGDASKLDLAREIMDVMRRAQGIPQVPLASQPDSE